ncbi:hypothetical protein GEMRC1_008161 [Eukaryota sp. GEM-RC1]
MNSDTDESTEEETDVHSESIDATAPPVKLENIEDASGEPEPDLWTRIQTTKIELPDWKNFFTLKSMEQVLSMMTIRDHKLVNNQNHIETVKESLENIISNTNDGPTQNQFAQHFLMHYIPRLEIAARSVGLDRIVFPSSHRLSPILHYMATEIITNYKTNMSEHFHEYVFQVFNLVTLKKDRLNKLSDKNQRQELCTKLNEVRQLIINGEISKINFQDVEVFPDPNSRERDVYSAPNKVTFLQTINSQF